MRRTVVGVALAAVSALVGLSGCGAGNTTAGAPPVSPARALQNAVKANFAQPGLRMAMHLDTTAAVLTSGGSPLTPAQARDVLESQVVMTVHTAGSVPLSQITASGPGGQTEVSLVKSGADLADLRIVDQVVYARVDFAGITSAYGLGPQTLASIRQGLAQASAVVPALRQLSDGQWVSLDAKALLGAMGIPTPPSTVPSQGTQFLARLGQAVAGTYQVTRGAARSGAQGYVVSVHDRQMVTRVLSVYQSLPSISTMPGFSDIASLADAIPANMVSSIDAVVGASGRLTRVSLPLNQFDTHHQIPGPMSVVVDLSPAGAVAAPSGATAIDPASIAHAFRGLFAGARPGIS